MSDEAPNGADVAPTKTDKAKPTRKLPTTRLSFEKQLEVLRAYAAMSGNDHKPVSNAEVASAVQLNPDSVSLCNPFWIEIQLLERDGNKQRPSPAAFDYLQAYPWHPESAAHKLSAAMEGAWFGRTLLPKLRLKPLTKSDAIRSLAEECKAPKEYEANLSLVLDYMRAAGVVAVENGTVSLAIKAQPEQTTLSQPAESIEAYVESSRDSRSASASVKTFRIPIPSKADALIELPADLDADDWEMLSTMLATYVERWKKFGKPSTKGEAKTA